MKIEELEKMADDAIARCNNSDLPAFSKEPTVTFISSRENISELLPGLTVRLLGQSKRGYCYLVDAKNLKQAITRFRSEF